MIDKRILNITNDDRVEILLFGNWELSLEVNSSVTKASINYIKSYERFNNSLF